MKYLIIFLLLMTTQVISQKDQARSKSGSLKYELSKNESVKLETLNNSNNLLEENLFDLEISKDIPQSKKQNQYSVAVVIGNKQYFNERVPDVDYALNDATLIKEYLMKAFGYKIENIIYLKNATQSELNLIFGTATNHKGKLYDYAIPGKSEIFIYYSGHGAPNTDDNMAYLVPSDCDPDKVSLNGYSLETFYNNLDRLTEEKNVKHVTVVLDACFSGNSQKGSLLTNISPIEIKVKNKTMISPKSTIYTSTSENQVSTWYEEKKMSLFTYFFLKGIKGEADINQDKVITAKELSEFINDESGGVPYWSRRLNGRNQLPKINGKEDFIMIEF